MSVVEMSVAELMNAFLDGLRALAPVFERAKLGWRENDAYDPWDDTASALFKALVGSSVENGIYDPPIFGLPTYDQSPGSDLTYSYITEAGTHALTRFVHFETDEKPFDTCRFSMLDGNSGKAKTYTKKVSEVTFAFVPRCKDGTLKPETLTLKFLD